MNLLLKNTKSFLIRLDKSHYEEWEYDLVEIEGLYMQEYFIVERAKGVRNGYLILKPFKI